LIDFLFYNVTFGFENVDTRFDTFSGRRPARRTWARSRAYPRRPPGFGRLRLA